MPPPLPPFLVSILEGAVRYGATHVVVTAEEVVLFQGEATLGRGALPDGAYPQLGPILRASSQPSNEKRPDGEVLDAVFYGPAGPLNVGVVLRADSTVLQFWADAGAAKAESIVSSALGEARRIGADRISLAPTGIAYWKVAEMIGVAALDAADMAAIVRYARELGGMAPTASKGRALVMGEGRAASLDVEIGRAGDHDAVMLTLL